mmetsp:Transcript_39259/g.88229  ORF Transcript_39259/g.88229 Transcript_39259/m.88229 type:complete len:266 (+) Transcript_39259:341-1138(+)
MRWLWLAAAAAMMELVMWRVHAVGLVGSASSLASSSISSVVSTLHGPTADRDASSATILATRLATLCCSSACGDSSSAPSPPAGPAASQALISASLSPMRCTGSHHRATSQDGWSSGAGRFPPSPSASSPSKVQSPLLDSPASGGPGRNGARLLLSCLSNRVEGDLRDHKRRPSSSLSRTSCTRVACAVGGRRDGTGAASRSTGVALGLGCVLFASVVRAPARAFGGVSPVFFALARSQSASDRSKIDAHRGLAACLPVGLGRAF